MVLLTRIIPRPTAQERVEALKNPGPSWKEYFLYEMMKWWLGLVFLIVDTWIVATFVQPFNPVALFGVLAVGIYLEVLAYRTLWFRPDPDQENARTPFRPSAFRLVRFGRWTPEFARFRAGLSPLEDRAPDPSEFL